MEFQQLGDLLYVRAVRNDGEVSGDDDRGVGKTGQDLRKQVCHVNDARLAGYLPHPLCVCGDVGDIQDVEDLHIVDSAIEQDQVDILGLQVERLEIADRHPNLAR